jgi:hypothetical protein
MELKRERLLYVRSNSKVFLNYRPVKEGWRGPLTAVMVWLTGEQGGSKERVEIFLCFIHLS